jgi:hypothetical protein
MSFKVGDRVVKNPATWQANDFDSWGRGEGVGVVVEPPFYLEETAVDVRWPAGRCFELVAGLLSAIEPGQSDAAKVGGNVEDS